jgi:undecaprenyl-diphosphatase
MDLLQAVVLGIVEGLTEFLPVSSTGHLTITEKLLGLDVDDDAITAFTAVVQVGAIIAVLLYFRRDLIAIIRALLAGIRSPQERTGADWRLGIAVVAGSIPIGIVGLAAKGAIEGPLRSLWVVGAALILWSAVIIYAERQGRGAEPTGKELRVGDALKIGLAQCVALIPGVSRSGATISAGLLLGFDRVTATRLSFLMAIPALTAAGLLELKDAIGNGVGLGPTLAGTVVAFGIAYVSIAWLLKFVAGHSLSRFVPYRVAVGAIVLIAMAAGW